MTNTTLLVILNTNHAIITSASHNSWGRGFLTDSQQCLMMGAFFLAAALIAALVIFIDNARYSFHYASSLDYLIPLLMGSLGIFFLILAAVFR